MDEDAPTPIFLHDRHEIDAVFGLLALVAQIDFPNTRDQSVIDALQAVINERLERRRKYMTAIDAFGFRISEPGLWDRVRIALGDEAYGKALAAGEEPSGVTDRTVEPEGRADFERQSPNRTDEGRDIGAQRAQGEKPKIGDAVIGYLRLVGKRGAQVAEIKKHLFEVYGFEMHEKTPGMTLYRLSKTNLVRREGRTWFAVDDIDGARIDSFQNVETNTATDL